MSIDLLFDTHTFIWWADKPGKLSKEALNALEDARNRLFLSDVSIWEMQIKIQLGRMKLKSPLPKLVESQRRKNDVAILPIATDHIFELDELPLRHNDPFDRLLIAQSRVESLTILTVDPEFRHYQAKV